MQRNFFKLSIFLLILFFIESPNINARPASNNKPNWLTDEIVVKFKKETTENHIKKINQKHRTSVSYTSPFARFKRVKIPPNKTAEQMVKAFKNEPNVEYAELNYYFRAFFVPNDPYYSLQWNFNDPVAGINIEPAWDITTGDPNVIVAVIDTGVAYENYINFQIAPDLASTNFVPSYDFVNNDSHANDDQGHGTHVTGTIAQNTNNSIGTAGISFNCSIMPVKVLDNAGEGLDTDIADGIYFAVDNGADIINLSLGGEDDTITLKNAVEYAYNHNVTVICAAGNEYEYGNPTMYPAAYNNFCIAVGATMYDRNRVPYSNTGSYIDLVAPGGHIDPNIDQNGDGQVDGILQQTFGKNPRDWDYFFAEGTSMAAPHVSAIAALLTSINVTGPDHIREALQNTTTDLGPAGLDTEFGYGLVNAYAALNHFKIAGDFNSDFCVNLLDLEIFCNNWLQSNPDIDIYPQPGDGTVDFLDFAEFAKNFSKCSLTN